MALKFDDYKEVLIEANTSGSNSIKLENEKYQTNHAVMGYFIASSWHLPKDICALILQHHEADYLSDISGSQEQIAFAALKAAENLVERVKRHHISPDWEELKDNAFDVLGITSIDYDDLEEDFAELI